MKIYFTGSHGSGKTTCARYVSETRNMLLLTEVARMVLSEKELHLDSLRHDITMVDEYQAQVFDRQLVEEAKYDSFVSDRSIIDSLAYSAQHARVLSKLLNSSALKENLLTLKASDSFIFFVRPCKTTLKADGVRESISWEAAIMIDAQIKFLFEMFELRYFQINTDNMQERIRLIDSVLSLVK